MNRSSTEAILNGPALAPPPGTEPNFDNPDNLAHPKLAVLQLSIATLVVAMRLYTKLGVLRNILVEDCGWISAIKTQMDQQTNMSHSDWLVIAWLGFAGFHGIVFMMEALPMGIHQWDLTARRAIEHARVRIKSHMCTCRLRYEELQSLKLPLHSSFT